MPLRCLLFALSWLLGGCSEPTRFDIVHVERGQVVDGKGEPIVLRGVSFGNWVQVGSDAAVDPTSHHSAADYRRLAALGVNLVRFDFSAQLFEHAPFPDGSTAFDWFDRNIADARAAGVRLIPTLASPLGGSQYACAHDTIWQVEDHRKRTVELWRRIAQRYASEATVAGYGLLNDPIPNSVEDWRKLAESIAFAIRSVDARHMLLVQAARGIGCETYFYDLRGMIELEDPNVLYAIHAGYPWDYVEQLLPSSKLPKLGSYPDETRLGDIDDWSVLTYKHSNPTPDPAVERLKPHETDWTPKRALYRIIDPDYEIAVPELWSNKNSGKVYFADARLNEYDKDYELVNSVALSLQPNDTWVFNEKGASGAYAVESVGYESDSSVSISRTTGDVSLAINSAKFPVKLGHIYEIRGWMKGEESVATGTSMFRLSFWKTPNGPPVLRKATLERYLELFRGWATMKQVPLYASFGTGRPTFDGQGGLRWVEDMLDLLQKKDFHFSYYNYRGAEFGIFPGENAALDAEEGNQELLQLLTAKLAR